jgi:hypothetical protein
MFNRGQAEVPSYHKHYGEAVKHLSRGRIDAHRDKQSDLLVANAEATLALYELLDARLPRGLAQDLS